MLSAILAALLTFTPSFGETGTLNQLSLWKYDGTNITQSVASRPIKLTGLTSLDCLGTNGSGVLQAGTCGSGSGGLSTTSPWTAGFLAYVNSDAAVTSVATTTLTASSPLSLSNTVVKVGGSNSVLSLDTSGSWTGNAGTATALAANGANCAAGLFPLGVSTLGAVESCTDAWTEAENTAAAYFDNITDFTGTLTDTKICTYDLAGGEIDCDSDAGASYTAGDALTLTGTDFDFDGGATPSGDLGGTWASPTVTDDSHAHTAGTISGLGTADISGLDISDDTNATAGDCLTLTDDDFDVDDCFILNTGDVGTGAYTFPYASTTALTTTGQVDFDSLTSAIILTGAGGVLAEYGGTSCTNQFINALSALGAATCATVQSEDINLGDTFSWNGVMDMGGAVVEISNGANPTADDPGELAHDTTDMMLILDDTVVAKGTNKIWSATIASTSPAFISSGLLPFPIQLDGYTITAIRCYVVSGTSKVIAIEDASANSSEDITCATTATSDDGSITNATYTAAELGNIDFGATSGAVDYVSISVFGTWTRE
jgi:hypothetical protein